MISKNKRLVYARDSSGASAVHIAAKEGHIDIVKYITSENAESTKITDNVSKNMFRLFLLRKINDYSKTFSTSLNHYLLYSILN